MILFSFCNDKWRINNNIQDLEYLINHDFLEEIIKLFNTKFTDQRVYCPPDIRTKFREGGLKNIIQNSEMADIIIANSDEFLKLIDKAQRIMLCKLNSKSNNIPESIKNTNCLIEKRGFKIAGLHIKSFQTFQISIYIWDNGRGNGQCDSTINS